MMAKVGIPRWPVFAATMIVIALSCLVMTELIARAQETSTSGGANECSASDVRCRTARAAFAEIMKVFDHPRCANCHGAFVVTDEEQATDHLGGHVPLVVSSESEDPPLIGLRSRDPDVLYPATQCPECHVFAPAVPFDPPLFRDSWRQPIETSGKMWGGKGALTVCQALINFSESPSALVAHINTDPLISLGFEGMRGMDVEHLMTSDAPEPPPLTRAQLTQALQFWIAAMEFTDGWPSDADPACAWVSGEAPPPGITSATATATTVLPTVQPTATVPTSTTIPTPVRALTFTGTFTMSQQDGTGTCSFSRAPQTSGTITLTVDPITGRYSGSLRARRGESGAVVSGTRASVRCDDVTGQLQWNVDYGATFTGDFDPVTGVIRTGTGQVHGTENGTYSNCRRGTETIPCPPPTTYSGSFSHSITLFGVIAISAGSASGQFTIGQISLTTTGTWSATAR